MQLGNSIITVAHSPQMPVKQRQQGVARLVTGHAADNNLSSQPKQSLTGELIKSPAAKTDVLAGELPRQQIMTGHVIVSGVSLTAKQAIASYASNSFSSSVDSVRRVGEIDIYV